MKNKRYSLLVCLGWSLGLGIKRQTEFHVDEAAHQKISFPNRYWHIRDDGIMQVKMEGVKINYLINKQRKSFCQCRWFKQLDIDKEETINLSTLSLTSLDIKKK